MKKLSILLSLLIAFVFCFGQSQSVRSNGSVTPVDSNLFIGNSLRVPIFTDTTQANNRRPSLDSAGKVIFTRDVNWFWGRQTTPDRKWVPFNNSSTGLTSTCGYPSGTHIVSYDSLLTFDVSSGPYVLCCDGVPRFTPDTIVTLDTNSTDFGRYDLIILDSNGINVRKGTPSENPNTPQTDSCEIILSYVLINAHDSVPSFVSSTNPFVIYDETYSGEWLLDSTNLVSLDTANTDNPAHLTHNIIINSFTNNGFFRYRGSSSVDLNSYNIFKFYARNETAATIQLTITFFLDNVQQTTSRVIALPATIGYKTFSFLLSDLVFIGSGTFVNQVKINVRGTSSVFYIDWIQLQSGIPIISAPSGTGTVTNVSAGNLNPLFNTTVTNSSSTPLISFNQQNADGYSVLGNTSVNPGSYDWVKVNLGTMVDSLLNLNMINPNGNDGDFVQQIGGVVSFVTPGTDTTFVKNWLRREEAFDSYNDTLTFGSRDRDSSILSFDTYAGLDSHFVKFTQGTSDVITINANGSNNGLVQIGDSRFSEDYGTATAAANDLTLPSDGNVFSITGNTQINAITTSSWQAGSQVELIFTGTPTVKNNTAGGAGTAVILLAGSVDFTAAANDVLSLVYDGTSWHETARKTSGTITAMVGRNGITDSVDRYILGGTLYKNTTITNPGFSFLIDGSGGGHPTNALRVLNTSGVAISGEATSSTGVQGIATTGIAGNFGNNTASATALNSNNSGGGYAAIYTTSASSTNTALSVSSINRLTTGTAANGIGAILDFGSSTTLQNQISNQLISKWTDATNATRTSQFLITGLNSGTTNDIISFEGNKRTMLYGRLEKQQGADVASVAGAIAVGLDGNVFELTGTNAVTLISNLNWVNGSMITFVFTSTATLTDGTANSGTDIGMELAGNANFVGSADDVITLVLSEIGGTQRWREVSRSVN